MSAKQPARWSGNVFLWNGRALYVGPASDTSPHAHHAVQICIGLGGSFRLRATPSDRWRAYRGAVVASDRPHQLDGRGADVALLYLDAQSAEAGSIPTVRSASGVERIGPKDLSCVLPALVGCVRRPGDVRRARAATDAVVQALGVRSPERGVDPRVARALVLIEALPEPRIDLATLAAHVGLSSSRFAHLFRAQTGLPVRRYLLWMRLQDAVASMAVGAPLTTAALDAGFADSAHLARTFRRMFGLAPSDLARHGQMVRAPGAFDPGAGQ